MNVFFPLKHFCFVCFFCSVCFKVFDVDRDGVLSRDEMHKMVVALLEVWKDNRTDTLPVSYSNDRLLVAALMCVGSESSI